MVGESDVPFRFTWLEISIATDAAPVRLNTLLHSGLVHRVRSHPISI